MKSYSQGPMLPSASDSGTGRWWLSLHSVDFVDGRNIPKAAVANLKIGGEFPAADDVRYVGR